MQTLSVTLLNLIHYNCSDPLHLCVSDRYIWSVALLTLIRCTLLTLQVAKELHVMLESGAMDNLSDDSACCVLQ